MIVLMRLPCIDKALGIKYKGHSQKYSGIYLQSSVLWPLDKAFDFSYPDKVQKSEPQKATTDGYFIEDLNITDHAAITLNQYGQGQADYMGFDILSHATVAGLGQPLGDLLLNGMEHVHPTIQTPRLGQVIVVDLTVNATVGDSQGQVLITVPTADVTNTGNTNILDDQTLQATFNLSEGQSYRISFWLSIPHEQTVHADIQLLRQGQYQSEPPLDLVIPVKTSVTVDTLLNDLKNLNGQKDGKVSYSKIKKDIKKADKAINQQNWSSAHKYLLKAADHCLGGQREETRQLRLNIDQLLRQIEQHL